MQPPPFTRHLESLQNGLRVVTIKLPSRHRVILAAYVRVGSRFESAEDNGLSHFLEHMLFRGTKHFPNAYLLNRAIEEIGGTLHAETRRDASLYQLELPPENLHQGLQFLAQIFTEPTFNHIETERNILLEEVREDFDEQGLDVNLPDLIYNEAFSGHPLGQKIIGPIENIKRFHQQDLFRHFETHYRAKNIILCLAGNFHPNLAREWISKEMGRLASGTVPSYSPPSPHTTGAHYLHRRGDGASQTILNLSFRTAGELDANFPALLMLNRILDDGLSTRLYQKIVNELGLAYYVSANTETFVDAGIFEIEAAAVHHNIPTLLRELLLLCEQLQKEPVSMEELNHAKRRYQWDLLSACDDSYNLLEWWGATELYYPPLGLPAKLQRINQVTPADVQTVAKRILEPKNLTLGSLGPMSIKTKAEVRKIFRSYQS